MNRFKFYWKDGTEEKIWKVVSTKQKAIDLIMTRAGLTPDEFGYFEEHDLE